MSGVDYSKTFSIKTNTIKKLQLHLYFSDIIKVVILVPIKILLNKYQKVAVTN